jgi:hypothetical protein
LTDMGDVLARHRKGILVAGLMVAVIGTATAVNEWKERPAAIVVTVLISSFVLLTIALAGSIASNRRAPATFLIAGERTFATPRPGYLVALGLMCHRHQRGAADHGAPRRAPGVAHPRSVTLRHHRPAPRVVYSDSARWEGRVRTTPP